MKKTAPPLAPSTSSDTTVSGASPLMPPPGMRDLLPPESRARRRLSDQLQGVFDRYGYELVTTPLFERVEVFERGLTLDPRDLVRFVEPDNGEIAALRPDITPQIARVVATRLSELPPPYRIRYEGTVIRRRRGRARRQRQIAQVGIELIGLDGPEADAEVVRSVAEACHAAGLIDFRIELSEVGVGRSLLLEHGDRVFEAAADALAQKDEARLLKVLGSAGVTQESSQRIAALLHLHGDLSVLGEAKKLLATTRALPHLESLERVTELLFQMGLGAKLGVDLGEVRGAGYYTGVSFALYARGPGEAVASGGRYDQLLARYGAPRPATGAAIDVENLLSALDHAGAEWRAGRAVRFAVAGEDPARARRVCDLLRAHGETASLLPESDQNAAFAYAQAWGIELLLYTREGASFAFRSADKQQRELGSELSQSDIDVLVSWARESQ